MASISSAGIGSGLDVETIVSKLMALEKKPLTTLQTKATAIGSKISAFGTIQSQLSSLSDAVGKLTLATTWSAKTVSSSNAAAVAASVTGGSDVAASSISVEVSQLAKAQSVASGAVAGGASVGSGTLSIRLGSWSSGTAATFAAGNADAVEVSISSTDTMSMIASKINAAGAGVTATVLKDLSGERLMLRSSSSGEAAGFEVTASDDGTAGDLPGLGMLAFNNPAAGAGMAANAIQYGQNAKATINGIAVSSPTNTLADTVAGLSLTLNQVTTAPVEISATLDTASMNDAIGGFVKAYNAMNQMLRAATKYDATTKSGALLQGDATTVGLQNALRSMVGAPSGAGALRQLSDLGITLAKGSSGDLSIDSAKLATVLKDPGAAQKFFSSVATGDDATTTGFATRMSAFAKAAIGSDGSLVNKTESLQAQKESNGKVQDRLSDRLVTTEARIRKQYSALDTKISSLTALNTYITQQIAQWNKSTD